MRSKKSYLLIAAILLSLLSPLAVLAGGDALYEDARKAYEAFWPNEDLKTHRSNWLAIIGKFERVYKEDPGSKAAVKAYYMAGKMCFYCYKYHRNPEDLERGRRNFETLVRKYPNNSLADDAEYYLGELYFKAGDTKLAAYHYCRVVEKFPEGDMERDARQRLEQMHLWPIPQWLKTYTPGSPVEVASETEIPAAPEAAASETTGRVLVREIKYVTGSDYTRVVIYCMSKVKFGEIQYIKAKPSENVEHPRLFIDIMDARLAPGAGNAQPINDGVLLKVRAGMFTPNVVRVVLDVDSIDPNQTRVFPMDGKEGDYRIVIDVSGAKKTAPLQQGTNIEPQKKTVSRIVLDPGHGGKDPGAIGPTGLKEKDVVLNIALNARDILQKKFGMDVQLTREKDIYMPLEERTAFANVVHIEDQTLFISLHANAADEPGARGIETYILDTTDNHAAKRLAAIENKVSIETINAFQNEQGLVFLLYQKAKADESYNLALDVQKSIVSGLMKKYSNVSDHGVKEAPFFVLMGAKMPCILTEMSFISNPTEEKRLKSSGYRELLAMSLALGVMDYIKRKTTVTSATH